MDSPTWKWEDMNMYFIVGLPQMRKQNNSIWVIVDRLTKSTHFIHAKSTYSGEEYARIYINEIVRLHGINLSTVSNRGAQFTSHFWRFFQNKVLKLNLAPLLILKLMVKQSIPMGKILGVIAQDSQ